MKRLISVLLGIMLPMQIVSAFVLRTSAAGSEAPKPVFTVSPSEITMTEGETRRLTVTVDPEYADQSTVYLHSCENKTIVSHDGAVTAYNCGEDDIMVEVSVPDENSDTGKRIYSQEVKIQVQPDETLPAETRAELDRLQNHSQYGEFQRRTLELLGILDENAPRITAEQVDEILHADLPPEEMIAKINAIHGYPDYIWHGDPGDCAYWLDEKGSDQISIVGGAMIFRSKIYDDGTYKEETALYPPEIDFGTITGPMDGADRTYIIYNQIPYDDRNPVSGDANHDGVFNLADIAALEKLLLTVPETRFIRQNWETADFNQDGMLNAADLTLMKRALLNKAG